ncbi:DUF2752 domain-containing protein [Verrucomicrobiaceae bacterium E54]|nr:DUF2752 domain-containing protein [Verrucomicrobiaceae bacterium E54]
MVAVLAVFGLGALWLARSGPSGLPWTCILHDTTGLHCAGCGMTRAAHALLEGRFVDAFRFNPLGVVLVPLVLVMLAPGVVGWVRGEPPKWQVPLGRRSGIVLLVLILGYTVLRNLPWAPFTLLAPP